MLIFFHLGSSSSALGLATVRLPGAGRGPADTHSGAAARRWSEPPHRVGVSVPFLVIRVRSQSQLVLLLQQMLGHTWAKGLVVLVDVQLGIVQ